ncbi:MAG: hypothetical protein WCL06_15065 [Bacteroidota bacterium]
MEIIDQTPQKEFLPEAGHALTLSIWGNSLTWLFMIPFLGILCCIAGIVLSIIGLKKGKSGMDIWKLDKKRYHGGSFAKTLIAFILGIVGIVQGAILSIYGLIFTIIIATEGFRHF